MESQQSVSKYFINKLVVQQNIFQSCSDTFSAKKRKIVSKKKWSDAETELILHYLKETKLNNKEIEKPSASIYYQKLINEYEEFKLLNVNLIRNKVRNLREQYNKAVQWLNNTGMGLINDNQGKTVEGKH